MLIRLITRLCDGLIVLETIHRKAVFDGLSLAVVASVDFDRVLLAIQLTKLEQPSELLRCHGGHPYLDRH